MLSERNTKLAAMILGASFMTRPAAALDQDPDAPANLPDNPTVERVETEESHKLTLPKNGELREAVLSPLRGTADLENSTSDQSRKLIIPSLDKNVAQACSSLEFKQRVDKNRHIDFNDSSLEEYLQKSGMTLDAFQLKNSTNDKNFGFQLFYGETLYNFIKNTDAPYDVCIKATAKHLVKALNAVNATEISPNDFYQIEKDSKPLALNNEINKIAKENNITLKLCDTNKLVDNYLSDNRPDRYVLLLKNNETDRRYCKILSTVNISENEIKNIIHGINAVPSPATGSSVFKIPFDRYDSFLDRQVYDTDFNKIVRSYFNELGAPFTLHAVGSKNGAKAIIFQFAANDYYCIRFAKGTPNSEVKKDLDSIFNK